MLDHIDIREAGREDWKIFKSIRLESLRDVPIAYAVHLEPHLLQLGCAGAGSVNISQPAMRR